MVKGGDWLTPHPLHAQRYLPPLDLGLLGEGAFGRRLVEEFLGQGLLLDVGGLALDGLLQGRLCLVIGDDVVGDLEPGFLAHALDAVRQLAGYPFLDEFRRNLDEHGHRFYRETDTRTASSPVTATPLYTPEAETRIT